MIYARAVPGENRVGRGNRRDLCQGLLAQFAPSLGKCLAIAVGEPHTPVDLLTAQAMLGDRERFLEAGFDGYLSKPVNVRELIGTVREHCDRGPR